ncbi:phosphate signaling complex protein PhoU [Hyphobacterium sp. HN65]|uniref:Phosphate-specific transport system accessory protein PhoU n=1 Tax=Hyphobacterium lacteum TaxID=3116575 RepID=A0ABU7LNG0_9PROT|nr:phosphate signaling complex protein PhoU [Hyphobacterium sp. HN65]MEE2525461.1 phosphate signaling complex protein PhoU [Hyphobacterium sp. HN65]
MNTPSHTVRAYSEELNALSDEIARMGGLCESQVTDCITAVVRRDPQLADTVVKTDAEVDALETAIERRVIRMLALRQPMASDLRTTIAAYRISGDLERIGDLAKNVGRRVHELNKSEPLDLTRSAERMGRLVVANLHRVLDAFASGSAEECIAVCRADEEVDEHYNSLFRELLSFMIEDPRTITASAHLLFVAKNLERIGDHITNIAEMIHYLVTGAELHRDTRRETADGG